MSAYWSSPFRLRVLITVTCVDCESPNVLVVLHDRPLDVHELLWEPQLPAGWTVVNGRPYCERHVVTISEAKDPG